MRQPSLLGLILSESMRPRKVFIMPKLMVGVDLFLGGPSGEAYCVLDDWKVRLMKLLH